MKSTSQHQPPAKTRIVFIITSLTTGGAERSLVELLSRLDRNTFECCVICLQNEGNYGSIVEGLGIPLTCLKMGGLGSIPSALVRLRRIVQNFAPHIVQCWMYHANFFATLACLGLPYKQLLWNVRNSLIAPGTTPTITRLVVWASGILSKLLPMRIIYNSYRAEHIHTHRPLVAFSRYKSLVISNGFDTSEFRPNPELRVSVRRELGLSPSQYLVGIFGRSHPVKDHPTFVRAAAYVARQIPNAHFLMCGAGLDETNASLTAQIRELGMEGKISLLSRRDDMPRLMAALDVMVLSSKAESFPRVVGEAMACAVPCVSTDVGDCRELIKGYGAVVAIGDAEAMAFEIVRILQLTPTARANLSEKVRARIENDFSMDGCVQAYTRLYQGQSPEQAERDQVRQICVG